MRQTLEDLMQEYDERFDDQFPLMMMQAATDDEIEAEIRRCLGTGKPFDDYNPDCLY